MEIAHHYQVKINWDTDRKGTMSSPVLNSTIEVATPPEFPKGMPGIWSPEHLLVAAVNSCLMTTFLAIAENFKFDFIHFESNADGTLEKVDGKYMITAVALSPVLIIAPDADKEKALRILEKSEAACLVSNSVKAKIIFNPQIKIAEMVPAG